MSLEENKALMRHWFDESNKGKAAALAVVGETCAADIIVHGITEMAGLENYRQLIGEVYDAFPDKHATLDDIVVDGDKVGNALGISVAQGCLCGSRPFVFARLFVPVWESSFAGCVKHRAYFHRISHELAVK